MNKRLANLFLALSILLANLVDTQQALAQDAGVTEGYSQYSSIGADQDSLLPPEVVPLDPSAASAMQSAAGGAGAGTANGAASVATEGTIENVPGLVNDASNPSNGFVHAKDLRKQAFEALYGQGQLNGQNPSGVQWQQGQMQWQTGVGLDQPMGSGQVPGLAGGPGQPGAPGIGQGGYPGGPDMQVATMPAQTQMLSGGTKRKPVIRDVRRGGFSNTLSGLTSLGAGAFASGMLMNPTSPMMGLGMFGLTMTGFGVRNAFRF